MRVICLECGVLVGDVAWDDGIAGVVISRGGGRGKGDDGALLGQDVVRRLLGGLVGLGELGHKGLSGCSSCGVVRGDWVVFWGIGS